MRVARIADKNGNLVKDDTNTVIRIDASRFKTKDDAASYLKDLETAKGGEGLSFCCSYGACTCSVHFRKETEMAAGKRNRARQATWVSDDVNAHISNCPGPTEFHIEHIPHNGLSLDEAARHPTEHMVFHLNIDLGVQSRGAFNRKSDSETEDSRWRKKHGDDHSYYPISSLSELSQNIGKVFETSKKMGLKRILIAHEGSLTPLSKFIVRNNAKDRMDILEGRPGHSGLYAKADLQNHHSFGNDFVFGSPRLVMFEAAQNANQQANASNNPRRANGWRYDVEDKRDRIVYDQLNLSKTGLMREDVYPEGALILARPFIHKDQNSDHPIIHWSIQSEGNIDLAPDPRVVKVLCWDGQNKPTPLTRRARQLPLDLRRTP